MLYSGIYSGIISCCSERLKLYTFKFLGYIPENLFVMGMIHINHNSNEFLFWEMGKNAQLRFYLVGYMTEK